TIVDPRYVITRNLTIGGTDTIHGKGGEDVLVGGAAGDKIDGGPKDDLIFGDAVELRRRDVNTASVGGVAGSITNPRFQALTGTQLYPIDNNVNDATNALNNGVAQNYRDANGMDVPQWAEYEILNLFHSTNPAISPAGSWGDDYIA